MDRLFEVQGLGLGLYSLGFGALGLAKLKWAGILQHAKALAKQTWEGTVWTATVLAIVTQPDRW